MADSRRVLSHLNGDWNSSLLFVAEAPGRLGAELTGVPLSGDQSGKRFETLLKSMGWERENIFITNAVLCNPRDDHGNNDSPSKEELSNCSGFLKRTIEVINPNIVVALGKVALDAIRRVAEHDCELNECAGTIRPWAGRYLGVLYHPGPRSAVHRDWDSQIRDAKLLAARARQIRRASDHATASIQGASASVACTL